MEEIREVLQSIAQSTLATASAAEAVKKAVEDKKPTTTTDWLKLIAQSPTSLTTSHRMKRSRHLESGHGSLRNI